MIELITEPVSQLRLGSAGPHGLSEDADPRGTPFETFSQEGAVSDRRTAKRAVPLGGVEELDMLRLVAKRVTNQVRVPVRRDRQDSVRARDPLGQKRKRDRQILVIRAVLEDPVLQEGRGDRRRAADEIIDADPEGTRKSNQAAGANLGAPAGFNLGDCRRAQARVMRKRFAAPAQTLSS